MIERSSAGEGGKIYLETQQERIKSFDRYLAGIVRYGLMRRAVAG
jgi:hypothetical protein